MNLSAGKNILLRAGYIVAMYTGLRAASNRVRSLFLPTPRAAILDGLEFSVDDLFQMRIRVHARSPPGSITANRCAGMLSIWLTSPGTIPPLYGLLRMTSHFGCGHIEIAFYEEHDTIIFYAIRNIVRSNAERIGCTYFFRNLNLRRNSDEIALLQKLSLTLNSLGLKTSFASPDDCVDFSVDNQLLRPEKRTRIRSTLRKKYVRIWNTLQLANK